MHKGMISGKKRRTVFVIMIFFLALLASSCLLFLDPGAGNGSRPSGTDTYGLFSFFHPDEVTRISGPLTSPATFVVDFRYRGRLPVRTLEISGVRSSNDQLWFHHEKPSTRQATALFVSDNHADVFHFFATVTSITQQVRFYESSMAVIDTTPPTIVQIDFYLTDHATLVPHTENDVYIWIHLHDEETLLFAPDIRNVMERHTRLYVNGRLVQSLFNPEDIFVTGSENRMIAIIRVRLDDLKPGENQLRLIMGGFGMHEQLFTEYATMKTASYPDETPPVVVYWEAIDTDPGDSVVDFVAYDSFLFRVRARDLADKPTFPPSGLDIVRLKIEGGPTNTDEWVEKTGDGIHEADFIFSLNPRQAGFQDGIYTIRLEVWDKAGNLTIEPPIFFRLGITQSKNVEILVEKISGNLLIPEYRVGDTLHFIPDTEWTLEGPNWAIIPDNPKFEAKGIYAMMENVPVGNFTITLDAEHKGVPVFGRTQITVMATPVAEDVVPPVIQFSDYVLSDPGKPFKLTVTDETMLEEKWRDTFVRPPSAIMWPTGSATEVATPYPLLVLFLPDAQSTPTRYKQVFEIVLNDVNQGGGPPVLRDGDRIIFTVEVKDKRGNTAEKGITFTN